MGLGLIGGIRNFAKPGLMQYLFKSNRQSSANPQWRGGIADGLQILRSGFDFYSRPSELFFLKNWRDLDFHEQFSSRNFNRHITNSNEKKTCLLLCLLCIFKFQTLTWRNFWILYFISRVTLYESVVDVCIQRYFFIRNWSIISREKPTASTL